ncbi:ribonuclease [Gymnopilus junonius]|uniref:ribonuclease T2 n=1 Tax=Gymnopilus junonius TaxID=109634 RepID=A0A9P5P0F5_GYMJU|nr:ribonuclease [Gymnopilus junonius]
MLTSFLLSSGLVGTALLSSHAATSNLFERSSLVSSGCSTSGAASCHNTSSVSNLCCFESPGGLLLQTQFWDTNPSTGPVNSWTIHVTVSECSCDTTFSENCDSSRDYTGISTLLQNNGATDTLNFMNQFWISNDESAEAFWEHEWSTHGTCYSTLRPTCLPSGSTKGLEAVIFFENVVKLFQTLPTFTWLENEGITPTTSKTFTLSQLTSALKSQSGFTPMLTCDSSTLSQIAWYFNLKGSLIDGIFVPIDSPESSDCPSSGIMYPPKSGGSTVSTGPTSTATGSGPTGSPAPGSLPSKATIHAVTSSGSITGGLLSLGTWSTQTLATYTLSGSTSSFTMTSSKGNCGVSGGEFSCGSGVSQTTFSAVQGSSGTLLLASGGSTAWSSDGVPSGSTVFTVFTGSGHSDDYTLSIVSS